MIYQYFLAIFCIGLPFITKASIFATTGGHTFASPKLAIVGAVLSFLGYLFWRKQGFPFIPFFSMLFCLILAIWLGSVADPYASNLQLDLQ